MRSLKPNVDLGNLETGRVVEIILSRSGKVELINGQISITVNLEKNRLSAEFVKLLPIRITIPSSGNWYANTDINSLHYREDDVSVKVIPGALSDMRERPLSDVPSLVRTNPLQTGEFGGEIYDVFISHASEDKDDFVRPLADALIKEGLRVWYDEMTMGIGDSLRRKIDKGIAGSRIGLVILSPSFISKDWTNYELDGIVTKSVSGEQVLLPIWHNITKQQVIDYSPSLADKVARSTANFTIGEIADEISKFIRSRI